jgi:hypothetical protein
MNNPVTRRDFTKLASAALSGVMAGAMLAGCEPGPKNGPTTGKDKDGTAAPTKDDKARTAIAADRHACRGLNECKGTGVDAKNACAGQGACATAAAHSCQGHNDCKGQGGCGETPGANECKGKGGCHVPMSGEMWAKAREGFEARMKKATRTIGAAPAEKAGK